MGFLYKAPIEISLAKHQEGSQRFFREGLHKTPIDGDFTKPLYRRGFAEHQ